MAIPVLPLLIPALVLLGVAGWIFTRGRQRLSAGRAFERGATVTDAEIIDLRFQTQSMNVRPDDGFWTPVVRFSLPDGRTVEAATMTGARPAPGKVGARVPVRYDPADPSRVNLADGFAQPSALGGLWLALGVALGVFGLGLLGVWGAVVFVFQLG